MPLCVIQSENNAVTWETRGKLQYLKTLTSGSAMMMRIFRSESKVKLANRLFRTNSPGLLSGSTLTGAMTTGPFLSTEVPLTGGRGGFSPTGEAEESQDMWVSPKETNWECFEGWLYSFHRFRVLVDGTGRKMPPWIIFFCICVYFGRLSPAKQCTVKLQYLTEVSVCNVHMDVWISTVLHHCSSKLADSQVCSWIMSHFSSLWCFHSSETAAVKKLNLASSAHKSPTSYSSRSISLY